MKVNSPEFVISQTATITDLSLQAMEEEQTDRSNVTCLGAGYKISCKAERLSMLYSSALQVSIHWRRSHLGQFPSLHADERPECGICRLYCADPRPRGLERTPDPRGPQRTPEDPDGLNSWQVPHPSEPKMNVRVQTHGTSADVPWSN